MWAFGGFEKWAATDIIRSETLETRKRGEFVKYGFITRCRRVKKWRIEREAWAGALSRCKNQNLERRVGSIPRCVRTDALVFSTYDSNLEKQRQDRVANLPATKKITFGYRHVFDQLAKMEIEDKITDMRLKLSSLVIDIHTRVQLSHIKKLIQFDGCKCNK